MEMEDDYMLFMAQATEDPILNNGKVEINDDEVYGEEKSFIFAYFIIHL